MMRCGSFISGNRGMVAIMVAVAAAILFGIAAFVIDGGRILVAKNELQNAADAASHAATRELGRVYDEGQGDPYSVANKPRIKDRARNVTGPVNRSLGVNIDIRKVDVDIGNWDIAKLIFSPGGVPANAVRVTARRTDEVNTPVKTYFARIWEGLSTVNLRATAAVAALTPLSQGNCCPFSISEDLLVGQQCSNGPTFTVDMTDCARWNTCKDSTNAEDVIVDNISHQTRCDCRPGESIHVVQGVRANAFAALARNQNYKNFSGCILPVYADSCSPSLKPGFYPIVRFETFDITDVRAAPDKEIDVQWKCATSDGQGGGSGPGALSTMPKMVQCGADNPNCCDKDDKDCLGS